MRSFVRALQFLLLAGLLALLGCRVPVSLPEKVSPEEYAVYSAFLEQRFRGHPPRLIYLQRTTLHFDPKQPWGCDEIFQHNDVPWAYLNRLHQASKHEYPLAADGLNLPWKAETVNAPAAGAFQEVPTVAFTRVALNRSQTRAVFAFSIHQGWFGGGGLVYARKKGSDWAFEPAQCAWVD